MSKRRPSQRPSRPAPAPRAAAVSGSAASASTPPPPAAASETRLALQQLGVATAVVLGMVASTYLVPPLARFRPWVPGERVPLTEVVNISERRSFSIIQRKDGVATVAVTADIDSEVTKSQDVLDRLEAGGVDVAVISQGNDDSGLGASPETDPHTAANIRCCCSFASVIKDLRNRDGERDADDFHAISDAMEDSP